MAFFYAPATGGFYDSAVHTVIPGDAVEITAEYRDQLLAANRDGASIEPDVDGVPQAIEPVPPTPEELLIAWRAGAEVSRFQAFAALYSIGKLEDATAAVTAAGGLAVIAWENAQVFRRNSPMIATLAPALGLTDDDLDALFQAAAQITA